MPSVTIPSRIRAAVTREFSTKTYVTDSYPLKSPADLEPGECIVKLEYAGVCHTDLHFMAGEWAIKPRLPSVGGHEGVGRVIALDSMYSGNVRIGDRVGIKYCVRSCLNCDHCRRGFEQNCPNRIISGYHVDGTFAEYMVAFTDHLIPIPDGLDSAAAAPILCAGLTVYNSLSQLNTHVGGWIVIPGAGGGLGHLAIQYAIARGLRVLAIDSGPKRELCLSLGAEAFIDFTECTDIVSAVQAAVSDPMGAHAALIIAPSNEAYIHAGWYVRPQGTILCIGSPQEVTGLPMARIIDAGLNIIATQTGGRQVAHEALQLAARGKVQCHYTEYPLEKINDVFEAMIKGRLVGRAVIKF
ncbi:mannitol-1-phosphate dehydrogenase MPDH1 [Wolfiporia cocos MD-104 SS10]|uniref:alcohol dehydrogenase n=1 Tax=Wolfiporia cocos (strain MD-104) TaxID=742152 RepID=A0A2H3J3Z7_WOLCO|nr:mannitol-1-phosphate dehydrogenase MPDH1 [Wolfiporia cocos MD-104 SS10]